MAKVIFNATLKDLRGKLGRMVVRKIRGQYFVSRKPEPAPSARPTAGQKAFRARFAAASAYAMRVQRDPALHAFYTPFARKKDLRVRAVAISDWFHPPVVSAINLRGYGGRAGGRIVVRATDEFGVVRVEVRILQADGSVLEQGEAALHAGAWRYLARAGVPAGQSVTVHALAYDRPARCGELRVTWPAG